MPFAFLPATVDEASSNVFPPVEELLGHLPAASHALLLKGEATRGAEDGVLADAEADAAHQGAAGQGDWTVYEGDTGTE